MKILAKHTSENLLVSWTHKELLKPSNKKQTQFKNGQKISIDITLNKI